MKNDLTSHLTEEVLIHFVSLGKKSQQLQLVEQPICNNLVTNILQKKIVL